MFIVELIVARNGALNGDNIGGPWTHMRVKLVYGRRVWCVRPRCQGILHVQRIRIVELSNTAVRIQLRRVKHRTRGTRRSEVERSIAAWRHGSVSMYIGRVDSLPRSFELGA